MESNNSEDIDLYFGWGQTTFGRDIISFYNHLLSDINRFPYEEALKLIRVNASVILFSNAVKWELLQYFENYKN